MAPPTPGRHRTDGDLFQQHMTEALIPGDEWPGYYRGYRLHTNADGDVWWQVYRGTDRLYLEPSPESLVEKLLTVKRLGGRVRVTESGDVLARKEVGDSYEIIWVGTLSLDGELVPPSEPEHAVQIRPEGLSPGDLWPSVYDGAKYSFSPDAARFWWQNPEANGRHPVETSFPASVTATLRQYKRSGGSFRVTPWGDVITLVRAHPAPEAVRSQFANLPRVVKNVIRLRKERGVEMLPIYVGTIESRPIEVGEPRSLTDELSDEEQAQLESWAASLGETSATSAADHRSDTATLPDDDPDEW